MPITRRSARRRDAPTPETSLPSAATDEECSSDEEAPWAEHRGEVGVHADQHEEDRDEHRTNAVEIGGDPFLLAAAADGQSGHERTDDEGQLSNLREQGEAEDHDECNDRERGAGPGDAVDDGEEPRDGDESDEPREREETDRPTQRRADGAQAHAVARHDLDDDREDDEADHVVGDCGAEDDTSLGRRQRPQIAEHAGGDPDARRGEGRAEEDGDVGRLPEGAGDAGAQGERGRHADDGHEDGRTPDPTELGEVHLHADMDQQQEHAQFGDHREADAAVARHVDEPEHRRADEDPRDDLAEHSRHADAFRQFGSQLRCGDDDQEVEQQSRQIDDRRGGEHGSGADARLEVGGQRRGLLGEHPAAPAHGDDRVRPERPADGNQQRIAPARAEVVEACLVAQLLTVDNSTGASQQDGEDRPLPRSHRQRSAAASHRGDRNDGS